MPYSCDSHRKFLIKYHIIFVCKYRKQLLARKEIGEFMKSEMIRISNNSNFKIEVMEVDNDHIHLLIDSVPNISATQIVRKLKQESTISVWKRFPKILSKHFWKERTFWTDGYFISTTGQASEETIRKYIENQG
jgi:putative transposase